MAKKPKPAAAAAADAVLTKVDIITIIGDVLTDLDILRSEPGLTPEQFEVLNSLRNLLDKKQLALARVVFKEHTEKFKALTAEFKTINSEIQVVINDIDNFIAIVGGVVKLIGIADTLIGTFGGL